MLAARSDLHCRILHVGFEELDRRWNHDLGNPWWRLYCNDRSGVIIHHPEGSLRLPAGRVCLVPAWGRFAGECRGSTRHLYIHFDPVGWDRTWLQRAFPRPFLVAPEAGRDDFLIHLGEFIHAGERLRIQGEILQILAVAVSALAPAIRQELDGDDDDFAPALAAIEACLATPLTVSGLAQRCHMSPDHFARRFRARFGRSPGAYVQERRVAVAAELLRATHDPIEDVAARTGFSNRFHFTRVFTRVLGIAPGAWRRSSPGRHQA
jgi:AraC-like DNA-binding protein